MLAKMRKFAKSPYAIVLLGPLLLVFAIVGFNADVLSASGPGAVVKAGGRSLSMADFKREFEGYKGQLEQRFQQQIPTELALQQGLDRRVLEELAFRESLSELLTRMGLRASDRMLIDELHKAPVFFDPVTGKFDQVRYAQQLRDKGLTPTVFEGILSDEMARNQFVAAAASGLRAPRAYSALGGLFALEQRDLAYFTIDAASVGAVPEPTEAEINAFIKQNVGPLPEFRTFTVVSFSTKEAEKTVTVDPAEVQKQFEFLKDSLSRPELRSAVQIPAKDAAQAAAIIARLNKGEDPTAVAKAVGATPVAFTDKPRSAFFDPAIGGAAFTLPEGGVSGAIKGQFGLAVIKVTKVTAGQVATFEEHREAIEAKVRGDLAGSRVSDTSETFEAAIEAGSSLPEAARKASATMTVYGPISSDGRAQDGRPIPGVSPQVLAAAFEQSQGGESGIMDAGGGDYFALRVDTIIPPTMPAMATIRPKVVDGLKKRKQAELMQARADALLARIKKGESLDAVAASAGATVVRVNAISRATLQEHQALGRELVGGALGAKKGEAFTAPGPNFTLAVAVITAIRAGDPMQVAQATEQGRMQFTQELFADITESARGYARSTLKTKTDLTRARIAMGVDPAEAAEPKAKDAGKAK